MVIQSEWLLSREETIANTGKDVGKRESAYTIGGKTN
jgi:hypothetical protein